MLNTQSEGSTVDYAALIESKAATKDKFKLKKVVSSPGGLTVKGLTVKVIGPPTNRPLSCCRPSTPPTTRTFARTHTRTRAHTRTISLSLRQAHAFTESAKAAIEENGGTCVLLSPTTQLPLEASA